ncbi:MAG: T9SS type A sorting domain-containing protein [Bacteroidetes bacterium]|nr:T9SS type A sorting domain-containing protein [Bacteroidota bacterium]
MKKLFLISLLVSGSFSYSYSQDMVFDWAKMYETVSGENEIYNQFFQADSNHLFIAGKVFSAVNDFDPDTGSYMLPALYNGNYHISMFDLDGHHIWSTILGSTLGQSGSLKTEIQDMALSNNGSLYVTGSFLDTLYYETTSGLQYITSKGYTDIFFGKMDTLGNWLWMKSYGGIYDDAGGALSIAGNDEIYLSGSYSDSVRFIPGNTPNYAPVYALFTLKFNSQEQEQWVYSTDNPVTFPVFEVNSMCIDNDNGIYIGGNYFDFSGDSVNFQSAGNSSLVANNNDYDGFLLKLDTAGTFEWVKSYSSSGTDYVDKITFNAANNSVIVSGRAGNSNLDFDPGTVADSLNFSSGVFGNYLLCLTPTGQFSWLKQLFADNVPGTDLVMHIVTDRKGNIHGLSTFNNPLDADPGSGVVSYSINPGGASFNTYSLKLDSLGNYLWSYHYTTAFNGDIAYGIGKDAFDNIYVGLFDGVGPDPDTLTLGNINLVHSNNARHFAKLRECSVPVSSVSQINDSTLTATFFYQNINYQWVNCDSGYVVVSGATQQEFIPPVSGNYALISTSYACSADTSVCFLLNLGGLTGITNNELNSFISIFPNPTPDNVSVKLSEINQTIEYTIFNIMGQTVYKKYFKNSSQFQIELPDRKGIYFIKIKLDNNREAIKKIIKE